MALPTLQRKLFQNDGYGPLLKDEIVSKHISVQDWSNAYDYPVATVARGSDGVLYYSKLQSGPGTGVGAVDPTTDDGTYWAAPSVKTMGVDDESTATANTQWVKNWANQLQNTTDYYIDSVNGDDTASGTDSSSPLKTMDEFWSRISSSPFVSSSITVHLEQGEYTLRNSQTKTSLNIIGPSSGYAKINGETYLENGSTTAISGGRIQFTNILYVSRSAVLNFVSNPYINFHNLGSVDSSIYVYLNGMVSFASGSNATITYSGTNSFFSTVRTSTGGRIAFVNASTTISSSGTLTGKRYDCIQNSGVSGSGSTAKFPGSANGGIDSTSYYN